MHTALVGLRHDPVLARQLGEADRLLARQRVVLGEQDEDRLAQQGARRHRLAGRKGESGELAVHRDVAFRQAQCLHQGVHGAAGVYGEPSLRDEFEERGDQQGHQGAGGSARPQRGGGLSVRLGRRARVLAQPVEADDEVTGAAQDFGFTPSAPRTKSGPPSSCSIRFS